MRTKPMPFRQWLPIKGRYTSTSIERPAHIANLAIEASDALRGFFCCQMLAGTGRVVFSFIIGEEVLHSEMCANDQKAPLAVDRLVERVHAMIKAEAA